MKHKNWLNHLTSFVRNVKDWTKNTNWSTKVIRIKLDGKQIPAVILQQGKMKVLVEPITHSAPKAQGVIDVYLMPKYDNITTICFCDGEWYVDEKRLTCQVFLNVLKDIKSTEEQRLKEWYKKMIDGEGDHEVSACSPEMEQACLKAYDDGERTTISDVIEELRSEILWGK